MNNRIVVGIGIFLVLVLGGILGVTQRHLQEVSAQMIVIEEENRALKIILEDKINKSNQLAYDEQLRDQQRKVDHSVNVADAINKAMPNSDVNTEEEILKELGFARSILSSIDNVAIKGGYIYEISLNDQKERVIRFKNYFTEDIETFVIKQDAKCFLKESDGYLSYSLEDAIPLFKERDLYSDELIYKPSFNFVIVEGKVTGIFQEVYW